MAFGALKKVLIGFGIGVLFIILSGLITGGVLFADFLLSLNLFNNFMMFGVPYGLVTGFIYSLFIKLRIGTNSVREGILFGLGFWLSFSILYIIGYLTFSGFSL